MSINVIKKTKSNPGEKVYMLKSNGIEEISFHDRNKVPVSEEFSMKYLNDLEKLKEKTLEQARKEGFAKGLEEGKIQARHSLGAEFATIKNMIEQLNIHKKSIMENLEEDILTVSIAIAEKIVREKVDKNEEYVLQSLKFILMTIPQIKKLIVYLNPEDYALFNSKKEQLGDLLNRYEEVKVVDDKRVEKGGVVVETENGNIDGQVSSQIEKISKELFIADK